MSLFEKRITTERLTLDAIKSKDFDALISILKDDTVSKTYMVPRLSTSDEEQRLFSAISTASHSRERYVYGIFLEGTLIGIINDTDIMGNKIELGYALHPLHFGKGYMTEALSALIAYLFSHGFKEIICGAFDHNKPSIRVMEKCGMTKKHKTEEITYRNQKHNCVFYSVRK